MSGIIDDFKAEFSKPDNALVKIILVNIVVFLTLLLLRVLFTFGQNSQIYDTILLFLRVPAAPLELLTRPWTVVTYFFVHEEVLHILFNMLFFYWFGRLIDEYLGARRLVALYVLGGLAGAFTFVLIYNLVPYFHDQVGAAQMLGASAAVFSVIIGASTLLPNYTFNLLFLGPVRIKFIALFYLVLSIANTLGPNAGGNLAHIGGALIGFIFIRSLQNGTDLGGPVYALMAFWSRLFKSRSPKRVSYREKTVYRSTSYYASTGSTSQSIETPDQDEVDMLLDKISKSGYESLTKEEKQKLFKASQQK